ncbi:DgyrCDS11665 [Dimorphilus gyrociliatus]|uniref:DgyrCDS11665 n=1 Tax=Dimorphilus gyrociliatus TaxID=2664684 RepID=A0A7I8W5D1_9ANNE|nr:DgyrCDS11665 [Dimorphilus gyrociliatus]
MTTKVTFSVIADLSAQEHVCISGNIPELGNWNPDKCLTMIESKDKQDDKSIWTISIDICQENDNCEIFYKYIIAEKCKLSASMNNECQYILKYETHLTPRLLNLKEYIAIGGHVDKFGVKDGLYNVDKGWLNGQTEIQLHLLKDSLIFFNKIDTNRKFSIKCIPSLLKDEIVNLSDLSDQTAEISTKMHSVTISTLNEKNVQPKPQKKFGALLQNDPITFRTQSFNPEYVGFNFIIYCHLNHANENDIPTLIGSANLLPVTNCKTSDQLSIPVLNEQHRIIGQLHVEILIIKPLKENLCTFEISYAKHWKDSRAPLDVGHRGLGATYCKELSSAKENTLASLAEAGSHGADFVEFDVQLSKDKIPIVYHDFTVCIDLKKEKVYNKDCMDGNELEIFEVPISDLTLEQMDTLRIYHASSKKTKFYSSSIVNESGLDNHHRPFPTLKSCFESLDEDLGFNIEIKYCMRIITGELEENLRDLMDRNEYVDIILKEVLSYGKNRRIIFSCFDPNICCMLKLKQNKYPVLFLSQGITEKYPAYMDPRCWTTKNSSLYCEAENFLGINAHAEELLRNPDIIKFAKECGLIVFCWGDDNNDKKNIEFLKKNGVDGVIYDGINKINCKMENKFKLECKGK